MEGNMQTQENQGEQSNQGAQSAPTRGVTYVARRPFTFDHADFEPGDEFDAPCSGDRLERLVRARLIELAPAATVEQNGKRKRKGRKG